MAKTKTIFICQDCGNESPRWIGKCPGCGSWNTYVEEAQMKPNKSDQRSIVQEMERPVLLQDVSVNDEKRVVTDVLEFDRVMGGGIVKGSVTLVGGDPGIGKSTLSLQISAQLGKKGLKVLYISGEESIHQTSLRAQRLGASDIDSIYIVNQIELEAVLRNIEGINPDVVILDSIQVVYHSELSSAPGTVSQVRQCASLLTQLAKSKGMSLFLIGHVTKEGAFAGPKVLEHIVDTVLYFEGERYSTFRILRATKNRFGSTNEIGVFEMTAQGLMEVKNPSEIFLAERPKDTSGSVVVPVLEGTRPFLVEIQGLVSHSSYGVVRQKAQGFDANRLALLVAVLEKRLGLNLGDKDIFMNVVGGVKVVDPAADLAVCLAIASALLDQPVSPEIAVLGEVGLSSEIRSVSQVVTRISEVEKLGFKKCVLPAYNLKMSGELKQRKLELLPVENVKQALDIATGRI